MFGFEPGLDGSVRRLLTHWASSAGSIFFVSILTNAFCTGRSPKDLSFLRPRMFIMMLNSLVLTLLCSLSSFWLRLNTNFYETTANEQRTFPQGADVLENPFRNSCHLGSGVWLSLLLKSMNYWQTDALFKQMMADPMQSFELLRRPLSLSHTWKTTGGQFSMSSNSYLISLTSQNKGLHVSSMVFVLISRPWLLQT